MTREEAKKLINECGLNINEPLHSEVLEIVNEALTVGEWIPCSERLPNDGEDVLIQPHWGREKYSYDIAEFREDKWYCNQFTLEKDEVIAWMPLPEPYKEETK